MGALCGVLPLSFAIAIGIWYSAIAIWYSAIAIRYTTHVRRERGLSSSDREGHGGNETQILLYCTFSGHKLCFEFLYWKISMFLGETQRSFYSPPDLTIRTTATDLRGRTTARP